VHGGSWASLASRCPNLNVNLTVEQVINTEWLRRILLPGIPLREYNMTAFYSPDENWSTKPLFCDLLPLYRHSLQVSVLSRQRLCGVELKHSIWIILVWGTYV